MLTYWQMIWARSDMVHPARIGTPNSEGVQNVFIHDHR